MSENPTTAHAVRIERRLLADALLIGAGSTYAYAVAFAWEAGHASPPLPARRLPRAGGRASTSCQSQVSWTWMPIRGEVVRSRAAVREFNAPSREHTKGAGRPGRTADVAHGAAAQRSRANARVKSHFHTTGSCAASPEVAEQRAGLEPTDGQPRLERQRRPAPMVSDMPCTGCPNWSETSVR